VAYLILAGSIIFLTSLRYTGDPLDFMPGKFLGHANRKLRKLFKDEVEELGASVTFVNKGGSSFTPGTGQLIINRKTSIIGTLLDEYTHVFNKAHGKGTYPSEELRQVHLELAREVKRFGSTDKLGTSLNTLYHQLELKNLLESGLSLPKFMQRIPEEELKYFLEIPTTYLDGRVITPGYKAIP
jgi:hypothetical protein